MESEGMPNSLKLFVFVCLTVIIGIAGAVMTSVVLGVAWLLSLVFPVTLFQSALLFLATVGLVFFCAISYMRMCNMRNPFAIDFPHEDELYQDEED
jgi:hypothetical protein